MGQCNGDNTAGLVGKEGDSRVAERGGRVARNRSITGSLSTSTNCIISSAQKYRQTYSKSTVCTFSTMYIVRTERGGGYTDISVIAGGRQTYSEYPLQEIIHFWDIMPLNRCGKVLGD